MPDSRQTVVHYLAGALRIRRMRLAADQVV